MVRQSMKKNMAKIASIVLSMAMGIAVVPLFAGTKQVKAVNSKDQTNTRLGTKAILAPEAPTSADSEWTGSYLYFGQLQGYDGFGLKWRVLSPSTNEFGDKETMLLQTDSIIGEFRNGECFDGTTWKNGFYDNLYSVFVSTLEDPAVVTSTRASVSLTDNALLKQVSNASVALEDKVFLPDVMDMTNPNYGYPANLQSTKVRCLTQLEESDPSEWALINSSNQDTANVVSIKEDGSVSNISASGKMYFPLCMNLDVSRVLFSTVSAGTLGNQNCVYKLTLLNDDMKIAVPNDQKAVENGEEYVVPYEISGERSTGVNQISLLILNKKYGNEDAKILYYGGIEWGDPLDTTGEASFELPEDLVPSAWGSDYYVYLVAEGLQSFYQTDYASEPVLVRGPNEVSVTGVELSETSLEMKVGDKVGLTATVLPSEATNKTVTFKSSDEAVATVSEKGTVTAVGAGTATITVTTEDGEFKKTCKITVLGDTVQVTGVSLDKTSLTMKVGESAALTATVMPENATDKTVTFKSSDEKVATVSADGKVTAVAAGTATIYVTTKDGEYQNTCKLIVADSNPAPTYKILDGDGQNLEQGGEKDLSVRGSGNLEDLKEIQVDGQVIAASNYTLKSGSTIVTLKADYLKTLQPGKHSLTFVWKDGTATAFFTIAAPKDGVAKTGETAGLAPLGIAFLLVAGGAFVAMIERRREEEK